jgi:hypothetical protein
VAKIYRTVAIPLNPASAARKQQKITTFTKPVITLLIRLQILNTE